MIAPVVSVSPNRLPPWCRLWTGAFALGGLLASSVACARPYDPSRDLKIPRPPRVVIWEHELEIAASPAEVWGVLIDFGDYHDWNPFLIDAQGDAAVGQDVEIRLDLGNERRSLWQRVYVVEPSSRFCWRDGGRTTAFVLGARCRSLTETADGTTRYHQELVVGGPFRRLVKRKYSARLARGIRAEANALAEEVEHRAAEAAAPCDPPASP